MREIGKAAQGPGKVFFVGGATALLMDIRDQTIDIDLKLEPEPRGVFESIRNLKERLSVNIELASPDDFLPALPGWQDRSAWIATHGSVDFFQFDLYSQVLSKILRGHGHDLSDARSFVTLGGLSLVELERLFAVVEPLLIRYPAVDANLFRRQVEEFIATFEQ